MQKTHHFRDGNSESRKNRKEAAVANNSVCQMPTSSMRAQLPLPVPNQWESHNAAAIPKIWQQALPIGQPNPFVYPASTVGSSFGGQLAAINEIHRTNGPYTMQNPAYSQNNLNDRLHISPNLATHNIVPNLVTSSTGYNAMFGAHFALIMESLKNSLANNQPGQASFSKMETVATTNQLDVGPMNCCRFESIAPVALSHQVSGPSVQISKIEPVSIGRQKQTGENNKESNIEINSVEVSDSTTRRQSTATPVSDNGDDEADSNCQGRGRRSGSTSSFSSGSSGSHKNC